MTLAVTILCALLCGFTGGYLIAKPKKRQMPPPGSALRHSDPIWPTWRPGFVEALRRKG